MTAAEPDAKWADTRPTALAAPYPIVPPSTLSPAPGVFLHLSLLIPE